MNKTKAYTMIVFIKDKDGQPKVVTLQACCDDAAKDLCTELYLDTYSVGSYVTNVIVIDNHTKDIVDMNTSALYDAEHGVKRLQPNIACPRFHYPAIVELESAL